MTFKIQLKALALISLFAVISCQPKPDKLGFSTPKQKPVQSLQSSGEELTSLASVEKEKDLSETSIVDINILIVGITGSTSTEDLKLTQKISEFIYNYTNDGSNGIDISKSKADDGSLTYCLLFMDKDNPGNEKFKNTIIEMAEMAEHITIQNSDTCPI